MTSAGARSFTALQRPKQPNPGGHISLKALCYLLGRKIGKAEKVIFCAEKWPLPLPSHQFVAIFIVKIINSPMSRRDLNR